MRQSLRLGLGFGGHFKQTEDNGFAAGSTTSFATNTLWSKIRFIDFDLSVKTRLLFTFIGQSKAKFDENCVDGPDGNAGQFGSIGGRQINGEVADNSAKCLLCDSGTVVVPIFVGIVNLIYFQAFHSI